jgi:hypothetical protein
MKEKLKIAKNANLELKNVNPNGGDVVISYLNRAIFILKGEIVKIEFENKHYMSFFLQDALISCKTNLLVFFTSLIKTESIKAFLVDLDPFYKKIFLKHVLEGFCFFI